MKNSKVFHSIHEYSCGEGILGLNIYNGSFIYKYPLLTIGLNSYSLSASIVYNSTYKTSDFGGRTIGFGNGWKVDIEEYLFPYNSSYNLDGFNNLDYIFIDNNWNIHRFVRYTQSSGYEDATNVYYDESGTGLRLVIKANHNPIIYDELKNMHIFQNERLVEIISSINSTISKKIVYSNNHISSFYDNRKQNRRICFNYSNDSLISINNTLTNQNYTFEYDNQKFKKIIVNYGLKEKSFQIFNYSYNKIVSIINNADLSALKIEYNNYGELRKVINGFMKKEIITEDFVSEDCCGDLNYVGENNYLTSKGKMYKGISYFMPTNYITELNEYNYCSSYTDKTNKKGITIRYSFDIDGRLLSSFEKKNQFFYTLDKPSGYLLSEDTNDQTSIKINGLWAKKLDGTEDYPYKYTFDNYNQNFINFKNSLTPNSGSDLYLLSFYVMFSNNNATDWAVNIKYRLAMFDIEKQIRIEKVKNNSWQKVIVPLNFYNLYTSLTNIKICFDQNNTIGNVYISDVRIAAGGINTILIDNLHPVTADEGTNMVKEINMGTIIYLDQERHIVSPDFYLTEEDVVASYKSLYYSKQNGGGKYDFFYNNKTKVAAIYSASLDAHNDYKYSFDVNNDGIPNFHFAQYDLIYEDDNAMHWMINEIQYRFHVEGNIPKIYNEIKKSVGVSTDRNYHIRLDDSNAFLSYEWINDDGTKRANKVVKTESSLAIHTLTHYFYDNIGNLIETRVFDENNPSSEQLSVLYGYSSDGEKLVSKTENCITSYIYYDEYLRLDCVIVNNLRKKFNYDKYNRVLSIDFYDNISGVKKCSNEIRINKKEKLSLLSSLDGSSIGFVYNGIGDVYKLTVNNKINTKYIKEDNAGVTIYQSKVYKNGNNIINNICNYDKYGNVLSNIVNDDIITYNYEDGELSDYVKEVIQIVDPFTYHNVNIQRDSVTRETIRTITNEIEITESSNQKKYNVLNDSEEYLFNVDSYSEISNGNLLVNNVSKVKPNGDEDPIADLSYIYQSDKLGRLSKVQGASIEDNQAVIKVDKIILYKNNTSLPCELRYDTSSIINNNETSTSFSFYNTYTNGNITRFKTMGTRFIENPNSTLYLATDYLVTRENNYQYDSLNRLISESDTINTITYEYGNKSNMIEKVRLNGSIVKEFSYVSGKMISCNNNTISYDNYGNMISIGNKTYSYNSRNLLSTIVGNSFIYRYTYNYQGIRSSKTLNNTHIKFYLDERRIIGEDWYENGAHSITKKIRYFYDNEGICGLKYDNYYFKLIKDSLGNVNKVMYRGKIIGEYIYDAWGNVSINEIAVTNDRDRFVLYNNPFRFKGYYYDKESNLYYLLNRYYSPELYMFISPDSVQNFKMIEDYGISLYCYCHNNPVINYDPNGESPILIVLIIIGVLTLVTSVGEGIAYYRAENVYNKYVYSSDNPEGIIIDNGQVTNSYKVRNIFDIWALSMYVRYYSNDTTAKGSGYGIFIEWICHNIGANWFNMENGKNLNYGRTLFYDFNDHYRFVNIWQPILMSVLELVTNPVFFIYDIIRSFV